MRKWLLLFALGILNSASAQKKIALDAFRYATPINYLSDTSLQKKFMGMLNALTVKYYQRSLADTLNIPMADMNIEPANSFRYQTTDPDTSLLHLFLTVSEYNPQEYFASEPMMADSIGKNGIRTVLQVMLIITDAANKVKRQEGIEVLISHGMTAGIGIESPLLFLLPKTFVEVMRTSLDRLMNPANNISRMGVAVPGVYMADNYIQPKLTGMPRTQVTNTKDVSVFYYGADKQMLRRSGAMFEEMILKGKNARNYGDSIMQEIKAIARSSNGNFGMLHGECRDVLNDKNYLLKMVHFEPDFPQQEAIDLFNFYLPGNLHYLLSDKDTIASFSVVRNRPDPLHVQYPTRVYNGYDTTTMTTVSDKKTAWPVVHGYYISGNISGHKFSILYGGVRNKLKEIYLDDKLVCIGQGQFNPDLFVIFDSTLPPVLFNQLVLIAFNRFMI